MFAATTAAVSGLHAASRRVQASASNIANARTTVATEDARVEPAARAREPRREDQAVVYEPVKVHQEAAEGGGVRAKFVPYEPPHVEVYRPDDRRADDDGMVARANVDYATEMINLKRAEQSYRANAETISTENEMIGALLNEES